MDGPGPRPDTSIRTEKDSAFEELPERMRYYMLSFKDRNLKWVKSVYNKSSLRDFTKVELFQLWNSITLSDKKYFSKWH